MSFKHLVLLNWKDGTTEEQIQGLPDKFAQMQAELGDILVSFQCGSDAGLVDGNASFGIVAEFKTEEDFKTYMSHPAHLKIIGELSKTILKSVNATQFTV